MKCPSHHSKSFKVTKYQMSLELRRSNRIAKSKKFTFTNTTEQPIYINDSGVEPVTVEIGSTSTKQGGGKLRKRKDHHDGCEQDQKNKKISKKEPAEDAIIKKTKFPSLRNLTSPRPLYIALHHLKTNQNEVVKKMGFGKLLYLDIEEIPSKLGYFVVDCFDCNKMEMWLATTKLLGIPKEGLNLILIKRVRKLSGYVATWRDLYQSDFVVASEIVARKMSSKDERVLFEIDFIFLFLTKMVECMLLYVDSFTCPRINIDTKQMHVEFWTAQMLKIRERLEIEDGGFGFGELRSMCNVIEDPGKNVQKNGEKLQALEETPRPRRHLFTISGQISLVEKKLNDFADEKPNLEKQLDTLYNIHFERVDTKRLLEKYEKMWADTPKWSNKEESNKECLDATPKIKSVVEAVKKTHEVDNSPNSRIKGLSGIVIV
ncbi:hypothetical protein R6Q57_010018 [Mikania cordata]